MEIVSRMDPGGGDEWSDGVEWEGQAPLPVLTKLGDSRLHGVGRAAPMLPLSLPLPVLSIPVPIHYACSLLFYASALPFL